MTIDEAIILYEGMAEKNQKIFDTHRIHIVIEGMESDAILEELYNYNAKAIEKRLAAYKKNANDYRQFAEWLKELKLLREQQSSEDAVSRQAVLDLVNSDWEYEGLEAPINCLPSVTPTTSWIPVSEKLPKNHQRVLVTVVNYWDVEVVRVAEYYNQKKIFQIKENNEKWKVGEEGLLAWRPLPEPYEEEKE